MAMSRIGVVACLAVMSTAAAAAAGPQLDGPYVLQQEGKWVARWVDSSGALPSVKEQRTAPRRSVTVPAVGSLPEFKVRLREPALNAPDEVALPPDTALFVVADTHGEFEILIELLQKHRIVGKSLKWSFGRGHLAFLGDVFDRGPNQIEILWLIYQLEAEASKAGGGVHMVLGNHEAMVMRGDLRYLNPKYPRTAQVLGAASYSDLVGPDTLMGQWLRGKPAVMKINDLLCLHGGISRALVDRGLSLADINGSLRGVLNKALPEAGPEHERAQLIMGQLGPLWYRGYFAEQKSFPTATSDDIDSIREHFGVNTILVGHTTVETVTPLHDGRVIAVQVYPHRDEKTGAPVMEALRIEGGRFLRGKIDGTLEPLDIPDAKERGGNLAIPQSIPPSAALSE